MILAIYCAGGLGREVYDLVEEINFLQDIWEDVVFVDDTTKEKEYYNAKVYTFEEFADLPNCDNVEFVIANGEPENREMLYEKLMDYKYSLTKLIHPRAFVSKSASVGIGAIIHMNAFISSKVVIEPNVYVQANAVIGHDSVVGKHSVISSNTFVGGLCNLSHKIYLGPGAIVKDRIKIGTSTIISIGSHVLRDIPDNVIAMGSPARPIKNNDSKKVFK